MNDVKLGKTISYALRHHPEEFGLELDDEGWVSIRILLKSLETQWGVLKEEDLIRIMAHSDKKRYEIKNGQIRALYGHSLKTKIKKKIVQPPVYLYHGTARRFLSSILEKGLLPMNRQYVHLSQDKVTAMLVGSRHDSRPVILKIYAQKAYEEGILFYEGHDKIWLSEIIPPQYIDVENKE